MMCNALRELFADELEEREHRGIEKGIEKGIERGREAERQRQSLNCSRKPDLFRTARGQYPVPDRYEDTDKMAKACGESRIGGGI